MIEGAKKNNNENLMNNGLLTILINKILQKESRNRL